MGNPRVNFGIIGAGNIGQSYVQAMRYATRARLVAIADVRADAAHALAQASACQSYDSYQAMCEARQLDAVIVCTPPVTHADISVYFLKHGIHVLCEKPLTLDLANAVMMVEAASQAGVLLSMASKFRYVEDVIRAKRLVVSGILGDIVLFENTFTSHVDMTTRWNAQPEISGGGVLIDNGPHAVDLMRYFLGALAEVQAVEGKRIQGLPVDETVRLLVRSDSGSIGSADLSWSMNKNLDSYIIIYGSHGTLRIGWEVSTYRQSSDRDWLVFGQGYNKIKALCNQLDNFSRAVQGEEDLFISVEDALASVQVVAAAYAALRRNQWVSVGREISTLQRSSVRCKTITRSVA